MRVKDKTLCFPKYLFYFLFSNYPKGGTIPFQNKTTGLHNLKTDDYVKKGDEIAERIERVFAAISDDPEITVKELSSMLNITQKQTENAIKQLRGSKRIHREGTARNGKWIVD